jgi:hypothetical protein
MQESNECQKISTEITEAKCNDGGNRVLLIVKHSKPAKKSTLLNSI